MIDMMDIATACRHLGLAREQVRQYCKDGRLRSSRVGKNRYIIDKADVARFHAERQAKRKGQ